MDTIGGLIDKLVTVDQKLYVNQELLYDIRRMTFDEFHFKFSSTEGMIKLWNALKKTCDLNCQRNALIDEIDTQLVGMIKQGGDLDDGKNVQRKHKSY